MKTHNKISLVLIVLAIGISVAFQNCSNVKFGQKAGSSKLTDDDLIQIDTPNTESLPDLPDDPNPGPIATATPQPETNTPELPNDPDVQNAYASCDSLPAEAPDFSSARSGDVLIQAATGARTVDTADRVRVVNFDGSLEIKRAKKVDLINVRGTAAVSGSEVDVVDFRAVATTDRLIIDADRIKSLVNTRSPLCLRAAEFAHAVDLRSEQPMVLIGRAVNGVKPRLKQLVNMRGVVILRGIDVENIVDFKGEKLVLENSVVGRMTNVRTDLFIRNSVIGNEVDVQGHRTNY